MRPRPMVHIRRSTTASCAGAAWGVLDTIFVALSLDGPRPERIMIRRDTPEGGLNARLHAVCGKIGRTVILRLSAGQRS